MLIPFLFRNRGSYDKIKKKEMVKNLFLCMSVAYMRY